MKPHKGFGLLEILITLVLLGVGVAGLVAMSRGILGAPRPGNIWLPPHNTASRTRSIQ